MIATRAMPFELKALDQVEAGTFTGFAAIYNVEDATGDFIEPGAFTRTLDLKGGKVPILWQHDLNAPIGIATLTDTPFGLAVTGKLNLSVEKAREVHALMRQAQTEDVPFGLSIGYDAINPKWEGSTRHLREIRLWEISPTFFPAQSLAAVGHVKSHAGDDDDCYLQGIFQVLAEMRDWARARRERLAQ